MAKVWIVTGASRGLGLALARVILENGDTLVATARNSATLKSLVTKYGADRVLPVDLDVNKEEQIQNAVQQAMKKFGRIDILVNNAGYAETSAVEDMTIDSFRQQVETNFLATVFMSKAVLPTMRTQGSGHIMQISSVGGRVGTPGLSAYQSSKWAVNGFSTVLAAEVKPLGIKVTSFEPGGMATDWAGSSMSRPPISEPYEQTVGATAKFRDSLKASWIGPEEPARAIYHISTVEDPPLRLLLGKDTLKWATMAAENLAASDGKWENVTKMEF